MSQLVDALLAFELTVTGEDVMRERELKPGPELGKAILEIETNNFNKLLSWFLFCHCYIYIKINNNGKIFGKI